MYRKFHLIVLVVLGMISTNSLCNNQHNNAGNWIRYHSDSGFSMQHPENWKIHSQKDGRVILNGPNGEQVHIWPLFIPAINTQNDITSHIAFIIIKKLASIALPNITWNKPQTSGKETVRMHGQTQQQSAATILTWKASPKGNAAYFYAIAADTNRYTETENNFTLMLDSIQIKGSPVVESTELPKFIDWRDPLENAFSLKVPEKWTINGGMFRFAAVDTRPAFEVISPDGETRISSGDAQIPTYTIPNPMLSLGGFQEGSWYSPGYGVNMMVMRMIPPVTFARNYVTHSIAQNCEMLDFIEERERTDTVQALNAIYTYYGLPVTLYAGEVAFTCLKAKQKMRGYYFVNIQLVQQMGNALWHVEKLVGYLTPAKDSSQTHAIMKAMINSFELNPNWVRMQSHLTGGVSQIVSKTQEVISETINDAYWKRQATLDELDRRRENAILGTVDVTTPDGNEMKLENNANYLWIDQHGNIVGTQTHTRPDINFRQLIKRP